MSPTASPNSAVAAEIVAVDGNEHDEHDGQDQAEPSPEAEP
jgi:hypothetical protein